MNSVPVDLQSPTYTPRKLLEEVMWVLHCKNRTELAVALGLDSGLISRIWNLKDPLTDGIFVRIMDRTNWGIAYMRKLAGVPYEGDTYPPRPRILSTKQRDYQLAKADILQAMPGTLQDLIQKSGWSERTVIGWLKVLRAGDPLTRSSHIIDWLQPKKVGPYLAVHAAGPGEDAIHIVPRIRKLRAKKTALAQGFAPQHTAAQHSTAQNKGY